MLRTNLSTRPFYNERAVHLALGALALVVLAITVVNVGEMVSLTGSQRTLGAHAVDAEAEAARLRTEAAAIRARINAKELESVANAAREANSIIDQRAFSWTELLGRLEATLPADVRITAVQPRMTPAGDFVVALTVQARRAEDLDAFIEAMEQTGGFRKVTPLEEQTNDDGLLEAVVEGTYVIPEVDRG